jgi:class 3 adenylate cyclase/tetratricopeptide (TPR) repeat protein
MNELSRFLERNGLRRYEATFIANDVDLHTLRLLSDDDLKGLGVSLGHRRKLIAAIAADEEDAENVRSAASVEAERRQLTVMFCDLVGSTALATAMDPERMDQFLGAYQGICVDEITRFDGFVEHLMGDGILAYFGYPRASEDAAERAVRAGLGVIDAVKRLQSPLGTPITVRIGIASGLVVTREGAIGHGANERSPVTGETVNLAARLQACAEPDTVVIAAGTRRLIGGLFELEERGPREMKGLQRPIAVWRVVSERTAATRFEATHKEEATSLVGRDQELALLLDRWELASIGEGQVVLLSGEAGIGKSRISQALCDLVAVGPHRTIRYQCSPFHTNSPLQPVIVHLEHACGIVQDDPPDIKLDKLERAAPGFVGEIQTNIPLLAALLAIPTEERYPPLSLSPEQQKERLLGLFAEFLTGSIAHEPTLLLVEDAHWIDPTTRELLGLCIDRTSGSHVLILVTFRPEFQHEWGGRAEVTAVALNRIARRQSMQLVEQVAEGRKLPPELLEHIVSKTDGIPLFIEELTKTVLESGLLHQENDQYRLTGPLLPLAIPTSLQDSLLARLDRIGPAKEIAQIGSVIGREFSYEVVAELTSLRGAALEGAFRQLVAAELIHQRGLPSRVTYVFKHALVQDTAYGTILLSKRQPLHARCAEVLQRAVPELAAQKPEVLAHHYTEAGMAERAIELWLVAGQRAVERSANLEAIGHLSKGLSVLDGLPQGVNRDRYELLLRNSIGVPLMAAKGYGAAETGATFRRARVLAEQLSDGAQRIRALHGLWTYETSRGEQVVAEELAVLLLKLAIESGDQGAILAARRALGTSRFILGDLVKGAADFAAGLQADNQSAHHPPASRIGVDAKVAGLTLLSIIQWTEGYPDQALQTSQTALEIARALQHANTIGYPLAYSACTIAWLLGDLPRVEKLSGELLDHARDHRLALWHAHGLAHRAKVLIAHGECTAGIAEYRAAMAAFGDIGSDLFLPINNGYFAWALAQGGQLHEALVVADNALRLVEQRSERWCLPEILRLKGEVLLARGMMNEAEAILLEAVKTSRRLGMRGWELRAVISLGTLWQDFGRSAETCDLVSQILGSFTEGKDTMDVRKARCLLREAGGSIQD